VPQNNRSQLTVTEKNQLIVDAYNANPTSMKAALDNFALVKADDKVLILGDMRELGESSREEHINTINQIKGYGFTDVYLVGSEFAQAQADLTTAYHLYNNIEELIEYVKQNPMFGKTVLIKGSNSIGLTKITDYL
jgi:UDP-N-acetylmuramoyl-tripeptide--D-alanyl-D-alanine ligase